MVRMIRYGYPVRMPFTGFLTRYTTHLAYYNLESYMSKTFILHCHAAYSCVESESFQYIYNTKDKHFSVMEVAKSPGAVTEAFT